MSNSRGVQELKAVRGLFVGRFQPLHKGHLEAIKSVRQKVDELIIVIGSSQHSHTLENPFTAGERITMVHLALAEAGVDLLRCYIIPVSDVNIHSIWVAHIIAYTPSFEIVFTNDPLTRRLFKESGFTVEPVPYYHRNLYSATEIRNRILKGRNWEELLPESVAKLIKQINGVERLQDLSKSDRV